MQKEDFSGKLQLLFFYNLRICFFVFFNLHRKSREALSDKQYFCATTIFEVVVIFSKKNLVKLI